MDEEIVNEAADLRVPNTPRTRDGCFHRDTLGQPFRFLLALPVLLWYEKQERTQLSKKWR